MSLFFLKKLQGFNSKSRPHAKFYEILIQCQFSLPKQDRGVNTDSAGSAVAQGAHAVEGPLVRVGLPTIALFTQRLHNIMARKTLLHDAFMYTEQCDNVIMPPTVWFRLKASVLQIKSSETSNTVWCHVFTCVTGSAL